MTKQEVSQRVLQNGKPLNLDKFIWDEKTNTFSSSEDGLVIDFKEINDCTFKTGWCCTFKTGSYCTFDTGPGCTFDTGVGCMFDTGAQSVIVRRDVYEVIELDGTKQIKLNDYEVKGYTVINGKKKITIDGKDIEISEESFNELKKQLCE